MLGLRITLGVTGAFASLSGMAGLWGTPGPGVDPDLARAVFDACFILTLAGAAMVALSLCPEGARERRARERRALGKARERRRAARYRRRCNH